MSIQPLTHRPVLCNTTKYVQYFYHGIRLSVLWQTCLISHPTYLSLVLGVFSSSHLPLPSIPSTHLQKVQKYIYSSLSLMWLEINFVFRLKSGNFDWLSVCIEIGSAFILDHTLHNYCRSKLYSM